MTCVLPSVGGAEKIKHVIFLYIIKIIEKRKKEKPCWVLTVMISQVHSNVCGVLAVS